MNSQKHMLVGGNTQGQSFARLLKFWRSVQSVSQEQLALGVSASTRHISFLENGKAHPSKDMVQKISEHLSLGEYDRNHMMVSAGYIPDIEPIDFHSDSMKWLRKAMTMTMKAMDPYPTTLIDSAGKIHMVNKGWVSFYRRIIDRNTLDLVHNNFDFLFSRKGAGNFVRGLEDTPSVILMSLFREAWLHNDPSLQQTIERLSSHPDVPKDWQKRGSRFEPMASYRVQIDINGAARCFYSVSQSVGAKGPGVYVSEPRLATNTLFPEDETFDLSTLLEDDLSHPLLFY